MNHWNHRIVRRHYPETDEATYGIHEAFYDENNRVFAIGEEPEAVTAESVEGLHETLKHFAQALAAPVLDYESIPEPGANDPLDAALADIDAGRVDPM